MLRTLALLCLLVLLTVSIHPAHAATQAAAQDASTIPTLSGTTFSGATVKLPADLKGHVGVLVIGFSQGSREAVTVWGKRLAADYYGSPTVLYYELPMLASVPKFLRGFVEGRIRSSVSDRGKVHFLPVTDDEAAWRTVAHYDTAQPDAPYVLLVDSEGRVRWRTNTPPIDATYAALQHQLSLLKP